MKFPIEMYRIREEDVKIKVPCERCSAKGIVNNKCNVCGGKGTHNKNIKVWKVMPRTETVEKIDRSSEDNFYRGIQTSYVGGLRYWISYSEFFNEESKLLHFNKNDAQKECDRRNANIADILKIYDENKKNEAFEAYDVQMECVKLIAKCSNCKFYTGTPCDCGRIDCPLYAMIKKYYNN